MQDVKMLETNVDSNIRCLKKMDEVRNLFTLGARKIDKAKLPQFSGKPHEDFIVFKTKMEKGFVANRIPLHDQVEKLRENLKDAAKRYIPENIEDID